MQWCCYMLTLLAAFSVVKWQKSRKVLERFCIVRLIPAELHIRKTGGGVFSLFIPVTLLISR